MRVAFAGTPPFAVPVLEAILASGHEVPLVLSQPDRPSGRGLKLTPSAVATFARARALALEQPVSLRDPQAHAPLRAARADVLVVAAYGLILPQAVLDIPARGCLNVHASLLPRWRGAAPVARAILAGDAETGVCIMKMEAGLDTGPVLLERRTPIGPAETTAQLTERLARLGAEAMVEVLAGLDRLTPRPQDPAGATYAAKIGREEAAIDWTADGAAIHRKIRGLDPFPGAETTLQGLRVKLWGAEVAEGSGVPGTVLEAGPELVVACGKGALTITTVQRPGGRRMPAAEFLKGTPVSPGSIFGA